ncbi:MAG: nucleotidyltransferase family protein [Candidatus Eisenbacteria bacterium]|uniref:Nucleotidyltransferase family protein n=1 Tax=Eiseniibacteriota bacterium TaxID=2212470 RepID=A0A948RUK6_UNCEI|nr:nucleotidyltransferase family protein [Candidatus Eisenbacteria bacterium]MBU1948403.1 nucleotidyltransferase family protein [Candidatus Eisenbacteria bacterium]MBU2691293.1 nucleotidyltransferase family protein [Candidatus Eisenbacteria bacterium]
MASLRKEAFWPTKDQEILLRAALLTGDKALDAWLEWTSRNDFIEENHDRGSFRLFPLVYKNLVACGLNDPLMTRLKGLYRYSWCANQRLFHETAAILKSLHEAGLQTMVLKGAPMALYYYNDVGVRPMADVDVLVPQEQVQEAIARLEKEDWRANTRSITDDLRFRHAVQLIGKDDHEFDLHWHVYRECLQNEADEELWQRSMELSFAGVPTRAMEPTDTLLHTVVHGIRWNPEPSIRWIPDAMIILQKAGNNIDWDRVLDQAGRRRIRLRAARGLRYLQEIFEAPIPHRILDGLESVPPTFTERIEYRYIGIDSDKRRSLFLGYYPILFVYFLRYSAGKSLFSKLAQIPEFMRYHFQLKRRSQVLPVVLGHIWNKIKKMVRKPEGKGRR